MLVLSLPWHWVGLLGMPRRMAYYDYRHPALQPQAWTVTMSTFGGLHPGRLGAALRRHPRARAPQARRARRRSRSASPRIPALRPPLALNGFALWVAMMIGLTVVNYGYPIVQLALAQGSVGAGRSDREPVMDEPGAMSWRNPWVRGSVVVARRAHGRRDAGRLRLAAVGAGRLQRAGPLGEHLPRRRRARELGPAGDAARDAAAGVDRASCSSARWRAPAAATPVGRGATLALNCTMCHGAQGMSGSDAPNLAGQYPEVVIKQLHDYKTGKRASPIMEALGKALPDRDIADLAAYYADLPKARTAPTTYDEPLPALVRVGDPLRNIAPCISCHGGVDQKFGTPWLEGMPKGYLVAQLEAFASGARRNDTQAQMRNMARGDDAARDRGSRRVLRAQGGQRRTPPLAAAREPARASLELPFAQPLGRDPLLAGGRPARRRAACASPGAAGRS